VALLAVAAVVGLGLFLSSPHRWGERPVFNSPLQNVTYELADRWADTGRPTARLDRFDDLPPDIAPALTPRDAGLRDGEVVPKDHPFPVALFALLHLLGAGLVPLATPLAGAACVVALGALTSTLTGSRLGAAAAVGALVPTTAFWLSASNTVSSDTVGLLALLGTALLLVRAPTSPRAVLLAGAVAGVAVTARYTNVVLVLALFAAVALARRDARRTLLWALPGLAVLGLAVAAYHAWLYGSPVRTGYGIGLELAARTANPDQAGLLSFRTSALWSHVRLYLLRPEVVVLLVLGGAGLVRAALDRARPVPRWLVLVPLAGVALVLGYYAGRTTWGVQRFEANASFLRYLLPVLALLAVYVGVLVARGGRRLRLGVGVALVVVAALAARTDVAGHGGLEVRRQADRANDALRDDVLAATGPDALILVNRVDKVLWPQRDTLVVSYLVRSRSPQERGLASVFDLTPKPRRLSDVIRRLCAAGEEVHLLDDGDWLFPPAQAEIDLLLAARGIRRTEARAGDWQLSTFHCA